MLFWFGLSLVKSINKFVVHLYVSCDHNLEFDFSGIDKVQRELRQTVFHAGTRLSLADHQILTNGGRVLAVVAVDSSLVKAVDEALKAADLVDYDGKFFRRDIAKKALNR